MLTWRGVDVLKEEEQLGKKLGRDTHVERSGGT